MAPTPAAPTTTLDQNAIAAIITAVMAQVNLTPQQPSTSTLPVLPPFCHDVAKSNGAALWFERIENIFRLHKITTGEEKVSLTISVLDMLTYEKVSRGLLPLTLAGYDDFDNLKQTQMETMISLMGMSEPGLDVFRTQMLNLLNADPATTLERCTAAIDAAVQTQREQRIPTTSSRC
uniref:Gag protein n=1 Tax=Panagrolaimus superbus TaxID=310955 RepID=A0A914XRK1_9BILA